MHCARFCCAIRSPLRHSREMTRVCSRNLTQRPAFGGGDNAFPTCGLRVKVRRFWGGPLFQHKGGLRGERRGSRLEPMKKVARMLRAHEPLILNWFRAKGEISNGAVEGLNHKIRVVTRRSYGFRIYKAMEIALYHNLGRLPEPESPHRFC